MKGGIEQHNRVFWGQICYGRVVWNVHYTNLKKSGQFETNCEFFELFTHRMLARGKADFLVPILLLSPKTACSEKFCRNIYNNILMYETRVFVENDSQIS